MTDDEVWDDIVEARDDLYVSYVGLDKAVDASDRDQLEHYINEVKTSLRVLEDLLDDI